MCCSERSFHLPPYHQVWGQLGLTCLRKWISTRGSVQVNFLKCRVALLDVRAPWFSLSASELGLSSERGFSGPSEGFLGSRGPSLAVEGTGRPCQPCRDVVGASGIPQASAGCLAPSGGPGVSAWGWPRARQLPSPEALLLLRPQCLFTHAQKGRWSVFEAAPSGARAVEDCVAWLPDC